MDPISPINRIPINARKEATKKHALKISDDSIILFWMRLLGERYWSMIPAGCWLGMKMKMKMTVIVIVIVIKKWEIVPKFAQ